MIKALSPDEKVHIVAYDEDLKDEIIKKLEAVSANMENIDFVIAKSDDVWARDTGPMFAKDKDGQLVIIDFAFDGWGKKTTYKNDDDIPKSVAIEKKLPIVDVSDFVLEGGSIEIAPDMTALLTKSCVVSKNRNSNLSVEDAEHFLSKYLGVKKFIWLDGVTDEDITDAHIDGFARFYDENTILTVPEADFFNLYEGIKEEDYKILTTATNTENKPYEIVEIPLTKKNVRGLDYKGSYLNFYLGNKSVLVPVYGDENDEVALQIISELYSDRAIVPINVVPLYKNGGMIHCVTSHQPF